jgi:hypothetical protein
MEEVMRSARQCWRNINRGRDRARRLRQRVQRGKARIQNNSRQMRCRRAGVFTAAGVVAKGLSWQSALECFVEWLKSSAAALRRSLAYICTYLPVTVPFSEERRGCLVLA